MKRRNYTAEIRKQVAQGRVAVTSIGTPQRATYAPRNRYDRMPWVHGAIRYSGREIHTVAPAEIVSDHACQSPLNISVYGLPEGRCGKPAIEHRPDRMFVRYVCIEHI